MNQEKVLEIPLVSVVVISYNSSKYILETLESIKVQTYKNVELIVTDDCSTDNTVEVCRNWFKKNGVCFTSFKLLESEKNTGVASNLNRGVLASQGEWFKLCAGDDLLDKEAISTYMHQIGTISNSDCSVYCLPKKHFSEEGGIKIFNNKEKNYNLFFNPEINVQQQIRLYIRHVQIPPVVGLIIKKSVFIDIGMCDERFPMQEDRPLIMRILMQGYKIYGSSQLPMYYYRRHSESLNLNQKNELHVSQWMLDSYIPVAQEYLYKNVKPVEKLIYKYQFFLYRMVYDSFLNNKNDHLWGKIFYVLDFPRQKAMDLSRKYITNKIRKQLGK